MPELDEKDTLEFALPAKAVWSQTPPPFSSLVRVDFGGLSHVGRVRPNNEDAFVIFRNGRFWEKLMSNLPEGDLPERHEEAAYVMAVADGIGGTAGGEVASNLTLRTGINLVLNAVKWTIKLDNPDEREK
jgi:serine/threonine protein phosphatase PrpC